MSKAAPASASSHERNSILAELDRALTRVEQLVPLDDARFLATHSTFEARSDQRRKIIAWLQGHVRAGERSDQRAHSLSIGCGNGAVDLPVARALQANHDRQLLVGVDPNEAELTELLAAFEQAAIPGVEVEPHAVPFDDFHTDRRFDHIHCVHSFYYMPEPMAALRRALDMLAPAGELVLFHAPCAELNALSVRFYDKYYERPTLFAQDFATTLEAADHGFRRERIDARVDVTSLIDGDGPAGLALRDFIVQFDCREMTGEVLELIDRYLAAITQREGDRAWIAHPVDAFVVQSPARE